VEGNDASFKTELPIEVYGDVRAAREEIRAYLCYYDTKRRHSSLNYLTPCEFERGEKTRNQ
jgi:transposase InsO family protein